MRRGGPQLAAEPCSLLGIQAEPPERPAADQRPDDPERQELEQRVRLRDARDADQDDQRRSERPGSPA